MMHELWHGGETANDDADCELGPAPKTRECQVIDWVR